MSVPLIESTHACLRVIVADPDDEARALYRESFTPIGCDLVEAIDGRDALTKAFVRKPALVLTELRLPHIDGYELCEILRRDRATANVPLLVATAETRTDQLDAARRLADLVLVKPTTSEKLLVQAARLLARSHTLTGRLAELAASHAEALGETATVLRISAELQQRRAPRASAARTHSRFVTTTPPEQPPVLTCPSCSRALTYELSYIGGVSGRYPDQWDYYRCAHCGGFQYRQRMRRLRRLGQDEEAWLARLGNQ